jgi:hypothetical protein
MREWESISRLHSRTTFDYLIYNLAHFNQQTGHQAQ